ncbi:MAG: hypothetical protein MMC23_007987 [Stictis urceolatum]|nr:hypothetical protein [Stictis urceolata]
MPTFPCTKVWSGLLYLLPSQTTRVLAAFHASVSRAELDDDNTAHAAGPIACFSYVAQLGVQAVAVNLVSTELPEGSSGWPSYWKSSPFKSLWPPWSTCKIRNLTDATDEMNALNPPGRRQLFATLTIKNDPATLTAAHGDYRDAIVVLKPAKVKELVWTLVPQPLLPEWGRKGDPNPLGFCDGPDEALVLVSFTVNWDEAKNDASVRATTRRTIEEMEAIAAAKGTGHRYRYLNYCAEWQKPFESYGEDKHRFLQDTGRKYDPSELFQTACAGMFKLGTDADEQVQHVHLTI